MAHLRSVKCCVAPFCFNTPSDNVSLHYFPQDPQIRGEWEKVLKVCSSPKSHIQVCSDHFTEDDYEAGTSIGPDQTHFRKNVLLKRSAIPSRNIRSQPHIREMSRALMEAMTVKKLVGLEKYHPPRVPLPQPPARKENELPTQHPPVLTLKEEKSATVLPSHQPVALEMPSKPLIKCEDQTVERYVFPVSKIPWDDFVAPYAIGRSGLAPQTRSVVLHVSKHFATERNRFHLLSGSLVSRHRVDFSDVLGRASEATGVSRNLLRRLQAALKNDPEYIFNKDEKFKDPVPKTSNPELRDLGSMRKFVFETILERKSPLSASRLHSLLVKSGEFTGSLADFRKLLSYVGFKGKHIEKDVRTDRVVLVEKHSVQRRKYVYLRDLLKFKDEGRPIVFTSLIHLSRAPENAQEETSILSTVKDLELNFTLVDPNEVWRAAMAFAGTESGFLGKTFKMWRLIKKLGINHYDNKVTYKRYLDWMKTCLIPNLPPNSVVVMDHDAFFNQPADPPPTESASKENIVAWLTKNNIPFDDRSARVELFNIVLQQKVNSTTAAKKLLEERGHTLLQVPPYYWELNPMSVTLLKLKDWIKSKSSETVVHMTPKYSEIAKLTVAHVKTLPLDEWEAAVKKCSALSEEYWRYHDRIEEKMDRILTNINNFFDTDSEEEEDDSATDSAAEPEDSATTVQPLDDDAAASPKRPRLKGPWTNSNGPDELGAFVNVEELVACEQEDEGEMEDPLTL